MRGTLLICFILLLVLTFGFSGIAEAQTGRIHVKGIPDRFKSANAGEATTGLKTVGLGSRVVLVPEAFSGTGAKYNDTALVVTSATWSLPTVPSGSAATIQDTASGLNGLVAYFVPDVLGSYTVSMTATTAKGTTSSVSVTIVAAKYIGAGISVADGSVPNTCACHGTYPAVFTSWQKTNHATAVKRKSNETGGHFAFYCMSCHTAGYDKLATAVNDGFDDQAAVESFTRIPTNGPRVFEDSLVAKYPKSMALSGIQCENCHGPAGQHVTGGFPTAGNTRLDVSMSSEVCAPCHYSSDRHGIGYAWEASAHARSMAEGVQTEYTNRATCSRCHVAQGYLTEVLGGQPEPVASGSNKLFANASVITCQTCHDPHNGDNPAQLRVKSIGDACIGCHTTRLSSRGLHTAHQGPMLEGKNGTPFTLQNVKKYLANTSVVNAVGDWSGWELPGYTYENSAHSEIEERCAVCHMASSPSFLAASKSNFTVPDTMMNKLGGHTFNVAYTDPVSGQVTLNPTGCSTSTCHDGTVGIGFVEETQKKTQALLNALFPMLPLRDTTKSTSWPMGQPSSPIDTVIYQSKGGPKRAITTLERAAVYNYYFVKNDLSGGVHNFMYAKGLLESSIEQLQLAAGAANIVSIADIPQDNGKKVQIVWNQFPAEKYSFNGIDHYSVFRQDPILPKGKINTVNSIGAMLSLKLSAGTQVAAGGTVWTYVGEQSTANLAQYSMVVPTIFDSTKSAGLQYSYFMIAGLSYGDASVKYLSPVDSGYSLNNVVPAAPSALIAKYNNQGVDVSWNAPIDDDIDYYEIYRGTTSTFTPTTALGISKSTSYRDVSVQQGKEYYYKVAAVDNGGNRSAYSSFKLTDVIEADGLPTEYALGQNYPNPFNPTTNINYALPKESHVRIQVFSITGEEIATIVDRTVSAGKYTATWNGKNGAGVTVSNGIYIYRIIAGDYTAVKKMIMLK